MRTLLPDPPPAEIEALLERRRRLGQDRHDEIWEGVLHMAPARLRRHADVQAQVIAILHERGRGSELRATAEFNLGEPDDYRVPDTALLRPGPDLLYVPTAALVVEVVSPRDETWEKLPFYAAHGVGEMVIVDPQERSVDWLALAEGAGGPREYRPIAQSALIELGPASLAERIDWPALESAHAS